MVSDSGVRVATGASGRPQPLRRRDANRQPQPFPLTRSALPQQKQKQTPKMRQTNLTSTMRTLPRTAASFSSTASSSNGSNVDKGKKRVLVIDISSSEEDNDTEDKKCLGRLSPRNKRPCSQAKPHAVIAASSSSSPAEDSDLHAQNSKDDHRPSCPEMARKRLPSKDDNGRCQKVPTETSINVAVDLLDLLRPVEPSLAPPQIGEGSSSRSCRRNGGEPCGSGGSAKQIAPRGECTETTLGRLRQEMQLLTEDRDRMKQLFEEERAVGVESTAERLKLEERVKDLQTTVENVKIERRNFAKAKDRVKELEKRVRDLERKVKEHEKKGKARQVLQPPDLTDLDDVTTCDICTLKMWYPSTIPDCGHTFCETCLHDWFNRTYTQHVENHPEFLEGPHIPPEYLALANQSPTYVVEVERLRREWIMRVPQPAYTCPACRKQVKQRPVEVFIVRDLVRKVAKASNASASGVREGSPGLRRMSRALGSIWDGFFPESATPGTDSLHR